MFVCLSPLLPFFSRSQFVLSFHQAVRGMVRVLLSLHAGLHATNRTFFLALSFTLEIGKLLDRRQDFAWVGTSIGAASVKGYSYVV